MGASKCKAHLESSAKLPCTAVVDGGAALGQLGGRFAMQLAMKKAREHGLGSG